MLSVDDSIPGVRLHSLQIVLLNLQHLIEILSSFIFIFYIVINTSAFPPSLYIIRIRQSSFIRPNQYFFNVFNIILKLS